MFTKIHLSKILLFSAVVSIFGFVVLAQENASISLIQLFPGQYDNTKFSISLADPEGIGAATVKKANGDWVLGAGRSCLKQYRTGTVTLLPGDFPLEASLTDCQGNEYETSVWPPGAFPIAELGNCQTEEECKAYCDLSENAAPCLDYAQAHNLLPQEEIDNARQMLAALGEGGPGGCQNERECESYCDDPSHMEECIVFARDNNLLSPEELAEVEMVLNAIRQGATPPNCRGREECDQYCSEPENLDECLAFGEVAGFVSPQEAEMIRRTGGVGPGDCRGKNECESYCNTPDNMATCMEFALEYNLMPPEEAEEIKMVLQALKRGVKMPNCQGKDECDIYCAQPENIEECMNFAVAAGFMTQEEAEMVKKTGGAGPGGCRGEKECETFCQDPANEETCYRFGLEHGFVSEEQLEEMREGVEEIKRNIEEAPAEVADCLKNSLEPGILEDIYDGSLLLLQSTSEKFWNAFKGCFQEHGQFQEESAGGEIDNCLAMSCSQAIACLEELSQEKPEEAGEGGGEVSLNIEDEIQAKIESCFSGETEETGEFDEFDFEMVPRQEKPPVEQPVEESVGTISITHEDCSQIGSSRSCGVEIGVCQIGVQICQNGAWGECIGAVLPKTEICDGVDNDCDGQVDESNVCQTGWFDQIKIFLAQVAAFF